ncbi:hypothetical protein N8C69_09095 [Enterococcus faecium]
MSVEIDSSEVFKALRELKTSVKRVENPALRKAAAYAKPKLEQNTPVWQEKSQKVSVVTICLNTPVIM